MGYNANKNIAFLYISKKILEIQVKLKKVPLKIAPQT